MILIRPPTYDTGQERPTLLNTLTVDLEPHKTKRTEILAQATPSGVRSFHRGSSDRVQRT